MEGEFGYMDNKKPVTPLTGATGNISCFQVILNSVTDIFKEREVERCQAINLVQ